MSDKNRRKFLKCFGQSTLASMAMPIFGNTLKDEWKAEGAFEGDTNAETYWELVKSQFNLAE